MTEKNTIKRTKFCPYCTQNTICEISTKNNIHKCLSCRRIFTTKETIRFKKENNLSPSDVFTSDNNPTRQATLGEVLKCK